MPHPFNHGVYGKGQSPHVPCAHSLTHAPSHTHSGHLIFSHTLAACRDLAEGRADGPFSAVPKVSLSSPISLPSSTALGRPPWGDESCSQRWCAPSPSFSSSSHRCSISLERGEDGTPPAVAPYREGAAGGGATARSSLGLVLADRKELGEVDGAVACEGNVGGAEWRRSGGEGHQAHRRRPSPRRA